jgi:S-adenosylmethionine:tRNA ribosyltransferase-isomerase
MLVDDFDFDLPNERIALHPVRPRDSARMLVVAPNKTLEDKKVTDLLDFLKFGDILIINDTKVIPAELKGARIRGEAKANISFNLHKRINPSTWAAFARPAKKLKEDDKLIFAPITGETQDSLSAKIEKTEAGGQVFIKFDLEGALLDEAIKSFGAMPLPPYIGLKRDIEERDKQDYQTIYAKEEGAVAAPTAGLHFTDELMDKIKARGVLIEKVTLHVGAGTFLPVKVDDTDEHKMHSEWGEVSAATIKRIKAAKSKGGRVVAVGTTSLRLLESAARETGELQAFCGDTDIFITPGYKFNAVDILMTNFHLPRSTLFMLVSAFSGFENMHKAYAHAIKNEYRFYSYGDASLLFKA